jgi:WD40 repeat protein
MIAIPLPGIVGVCFRLKQDTIPNHKYGVSWIGFSPDGASLATTDVDGRGWLWDPRTLRRQASLPAHSDTIIAAAFHPDGSILAGASLDNTVSIWDVATGSRIRRLAGHAESVRSLAFSPTGNMLATGDHGTTLRIWNTDSWSVMSTFSGCDNGINTLQFTPASDRLLALVAYTATYVVVPDGSRPAIQLAGSAASTASISPDGKLIATTEHEGRTVLWDTGSGKQLKTLQGPDGRRHMAYPVFSRDGKRLFVASNLPYAHSYGIDVWELKNTTCIARLYGHSGEIGPIVMSEDGSVLASVAAEDTTVRLWDTNTFQCLAVLSEPNVELEHIAFSPDGTVLAVGSGGADKVWLWQLAREVEDACRVPPNRSSGRSSGDADRKNTPQDQPTDGDPASDAPTPENGD